MTKNVYNKSSFIYKINFRQIIINLDRLKALHLAIGGHYCIVFHQAGPVVGVVLQTTYNILHEDFKVKFRR